jgi:hypothetical protein
MPIGSKSGQIEHGTFKEHFSFLQNVLTKAIQEGAATPEEYQGTLLQILKAVEAMRLKNEAALMELERQKAYHQAATNVCSMMGSLILNIVDARTRERLRILEGARLIEQREVREDKERLVELRASGENEKADELEKSLVLREADLKASVELSLGSLKEQEITREAVGKTQEILGGILTQAPQNTRTQEMHAIQEVVGYSLKEVPVQEKPVIAQAEEKKKRGRKPIIR